MTILHIDEPPTLNEMRFCRSEDRLAWIDEEVQRLGGGIGRRHIGAIVFGTPTKPYKVNLYGYSRGKFETFDAAAAFARTYA